MEEFWKDINHVPLISPHYVPSSSSSSPSPSPSSASKLHGFLAQPPRIDSSSSSSANPKFASSASLVPCSTHKRLSESDCDRRSKRMIKNRESAARSRARKQAYTNELEQELALLKEENAMLTEQLQRMDDAPTTSEQKLKKPPSRTLTAPF
ncbi:bZIP transcription factor 27 [Prosopis cineraria]|uniref:bZIP transcription factor 27 n=1 Tax=Prosopis cineraria TaxID=364024 RepID=UPI0024100985|nr:bZIP transcription factor 27 [Prosopis cineraria]